MATNQPGVNQPGVTRNQPGVTRKDFLRGVGAAGAGGLVVGGVAGFFGGRASESTAPSTAAASTSKQPIVIGSGVPVTGVYAGDGQQMQRGQQLAVAEINAAGGVLGRPLKLAVLDTQAQQPDVMKSVLQKFVSQNVAAIFVPFTTYTSVEYPVVGHAGIPMFHVNTWHGNVDFVKQNGFKNIFQGDPSETWYGPGFVTLIQDLLAKKAWTPSSKTMAVVTSNDPYSLNIAKTFQSSMQKLGWKSTMFQEFTVPQADWSATLVKIRSQPPGIVFFSDYAAGDWANCLMNDASSPAA